MERVGPSPALVAGTQIDKYQLVRVIGSGGMGVVWAAYDPDLDREVALKVLRSDDAGQMLRTRLLREARAMARLKHPNVLTVYEVGTEYDRDYIAMELVEGGNLDTWLATKPPRAQVWAAVLAAGRGLAAAHAAGLVHRDFKPHNVLRSEDGRVMVTDFGLARGVAEAETDSVGAQTVREGKPAVRASGVEATVAVQDETVESKPGPTAAGVDSSPAHEETVAAADARTGSKSATGTDPTRASAGTEETVAVDSQRGSKPGTTTSRRRADALLDSPLTQTGAMLGTPAYMAPEQFSGGFAGARSDQFAFCVTAWQALAGSRPFQGDTMAELMRAVLRGPGDVEADLPGAVRAVLVRGLDPDPAKRWPDLAQLLAALDRAGGQSRRRATLALAVLGVMMLVALAAFALKKDPAPVAAAPPPACPDAAVAFSTAWSPELRASVAATHATPGFARAAALLDTFRTLWMTAYTRVCAAPSDQRFHARVSCFDGVRDELAAQVKLFAQVPAAAFDSLDVREILPQLSECSSEHPIAPPDLPADPVKQKAIQEARADVFAARVLPPAAGIEAIAKVEEKLPAIGWKPLEAEVYWAAGLIAQRAARHDVARRSLSRAARVAALARYFRVETRARVALIESAIARTADPRDPDEIKLLFEEAEDAIASSGGSRALTATMDGLRADAFSAQLRFDKAIAPAERALAVFIELGDARHASVVGARLAMYYAVRDDLAKARATIERTEQVALSQGQPVDIDLDEVGAEIAFRQGDLDEVHRRIARSRPRTPETKVTWTGRVVDETGAPVAGAHVVGWVGDLPGDAKRLNTSPAGNVEATTDSTGGFTLVADAMSAVAAELGERRSPPLRAPTDPAKPIVIALGATRTITGHVVTDDDPLTGVSAEATISVGDATLIIQTLVTSKGAFSIANVPLGAAKVQIAASAGEQARRIVHAGLARGEITVGWPTVQPLDVIVRGATDVDIFVVAGKIAPRSREELFAAAERAPTYAYSDTTGIGADTTAAGRQFYTSHDVHAIIDGVAVESTACAVQREPGALPECKVVTPNVLRVVVRDGQHYANAIAVVLEVGELIGAPTAITDER